MKKTSLAIERLYASVLREIGATSEPAYLDVKNTPRRVAKMLVTEMLSGYRTTKRQLINQLQFVPAEGIRELVVQSHIPFTSLCAHHMLPFTGEAAIGYLPKNKVIGLSKLSRVLDHFSKRLQIQERLGAQIADFLLEEIEADFVAVVLDAEHLCMSCRGVKKTGVRTTTSSVRPLPPNNPMLAEFYILAGMTRAIGQ